MKLLICFGTRPEAIKMAPICLKLDEFHIAYTLCVTAQHREMLDQVLDFFELVPDYDLDLMKPDQSLNELSSRILKQIDEVLVKETFDLVLVHGDTTTSAIVALAAFYRNCKVMHIEAGLRTYNKQSPFPEELNRQITGKIADYHCVPTKQAETNLLKERIDKKDIIITGNTVVDALFITLEKIKSGYTNPIIESIKKEINFDKKLILVTGHRRESFGEGFENICNAILQLAERDDVEIVYPVHLNPSVRKTVFKKLSDKHNIKLIEPLDYSSFVWLMSKAYFIISDSGGIQEEAPSLGIPVLVTRGTTERYEGVKAGCSVLVGTNTSKIVNASKQLLDDNKTGITSNPYGDGKASAKILNFIEKISTDF